MKHTPSSRVLVLVSPQGHLTMRRADYLRRVPDDPVRRWQKLIHFRLRSGDSFEELKDEVYGWAVHTYDL